MNEYQQKALPYIEAGLKQGAAHIVAFSIEDIVFDSRSLLKCMFGCPEWGKNYTCPSASNVTMEQYKEMFSRYKWGLIVHTHDRHLSQQVSYALEVKAFHEGYYFAFSLSDCNLCEECGAATGVPCRHRSMARPAFHSVGIDVFATVKKFSLPLYALDNEGKPEENWYSAVFME